MCAYFRGGKRRLRLCILCFSLSCYKRVLLFANLIIAHVPCPFLNEQTYASEALELRISDGLGHALSPDPGDAALQRLWLQYYCSLHLQTMAEPGFCLSANSVFSSSKI